MAFGVWEVGGHYGSSNEQEFVGAVQRPLDLSVILFDTALGYGAGRPKALLSRALGEFTPEWNNSMAAAALATRPVVIIFLFLQRQLVQGLTGGAVKG